MRRRIGEVAAFVLMAIALMAPATAQEAEPLELRIEGIDTADHPEVTMIVSVPPEMVGKDLTSEDFTVTEDDQIRAVVATPVPTDGLQVVLLLDASGSMGGRPIVAAKAAAQDFLNAMPDGVEVAVVSFADEPIVLSAFTTDKTQTSAAISDLKLGKNTALYDGLVAGSEIFDSEGSTRRTLVLLSDGGDTASETTLEDSIISLLDADVGFYAVELQSSEYDAEALARLGVATDGIVVPAEDPEGLAAVFVDVASQIVNRYEIKYESEVYGRNVVGVEAEADGLIARASQGVRYPAPPPTPVEPSEPTPVPEVEAAPTPVVPRTGAIVVVDWAQSQSALLLGLAAVFLALVLLLLVTGITRPKDRHLVGAEAEKSSFGESKGKRLSRIAEQATLVAERTATRRSNRSSRSASMLEKAGIHMRLGELIVLSIAAALAVAAITLILSNGWMALLFGVLTLLLVRGWVDHKVTKRQEAFAGQLVDVLQLMAGSIRSGFGLMQAMDTVASEIAAPAGEEFQRVKIEAQLGRDANEALLAMADRVGSEDFKWVVEAIDIHREVGGDLADILDSVMETVRDRIRIRRRIRTLSAEGRMSGWVLTLLPVILIGLLLLTNPSYLDPLFGTLIGQLLIGFGLVLIVIGGFWMRHITSLKF